MDRLLIFFSYALVPILLLGVVDFLSFCCSHGLQIRTSQELRND